MQSEGSHDVSNGVTQTIVRWYEQTQNNIKNKKLVRPNFDSELLGILLAARRQTEGALTTLANNNVLSTHALLRILVETFVVLAWALKVDAEEEKAKCDEVYRRLRRWDYTRLRKDKALLDGLSRTPEIESAIEQAKSDVDALKKNGIEPLPNYEQLFRYLGGDKPDTVKEWEEVYAKFYRRYSRAVHLNRNVTQQLSWIEDEDERPRAIQYKADIEPDGDELRNIASISCDINKVIRDFYGWDSDEMRKEYCQLNQD